jgi:CNT family concentrative nucleoside transporter
MTYPATIFLTKLAVPETERPETLGHVRTHNERPDANVLGAAARGTREGLELALNIAAVLIAFIALVALANLLVAELGRWIGQPNLTLQGILGMAAAPIAWLIGIPWSESHAVGSTLGTRFVLNELIAYGDLGEMRDSLAPRSHSIATIALCGFANLSSIGIQVGGISALAPERRNDLAKLGLKVLLVSTLANYLSASIAGVLL